MHGIVLKDLGHNVTILERSSPSEFLSQGAGISAQKHAQDFLARYNIPTASLFVDCPKVQFLDKQAKVMKTMDMPLRMTSWSILYRHLRTRFDDPSSNATKIEDSPMSIQRRGRSTYRFDTTVIGLEDKGEKVLVSMNSASEIEEQILVDLVIAADGPSAKIREMLDPTLRRSYAGYVAWRGIVPEIDIPESITNLLRYRCTYHSAFPGHIVM